MFDHILLIYFYDSLQYNGDVSPESISGMNCWYNQCGRKCIFCYWLVKYYAVLTDTTCICFGRHYSLWGYVAGYSEDICFWERLNSSHDNSELSLLVFTEHRGPCYSVIWTTSYNTGLKAYIRSEFAWLWSWLVEVCHPPCI